MTLYRAALAGVGAVLAVLAAVFAAGSPPAAGTSVPPPSSPELDGGASGVVLVGVAALAWPDINAEDTPTLWALAGEHGAASLSVRTIRSRTCPVDGWLSVGAGRRAIDLEDTSGDGTPDRFCRSAPGPVEVDGAVHVPGWDELVERQDEQDYGTVLGLLGERLHQAGVCSTAVGPGAALALADSSGEVSGYVPSLAELAPEQLSVCPITVVDLGSLPVSSPHPEDPDAAYIDERRTSAASVDAALAELLSDIPDGVAVLVAGIADSAPAEPPAEDEPLMISPSGLRLAVAAGPTPAGAEYGPSWLTSSTTRWPGLVQLTDLHPTLAAFAGLDVPTAGTVGAPWRPDGPHPADAAATVDELISADRATQVFRTQSGPFFQLLGVVQVLVFGAAFLWLRRRPDVRSRMLRLVQVFAIAVAAFPVASFLANLAGWWRFERAGTVLWITIFTITATLAVITLAGPWRRHVYGPPGVLAGFTAVVLAADVATGANLQHASLLGLSPVVAGRFFGFGNIAFAIFVASAMVATAALAQWLRDRGVAPTAVTAAAAFAGVATVVVMGAPGAGANFGGTLSTLPGFAVLVIGISGASITLVKLAIAGIAAVVVVTTVAWLDWMRPPESRTHFGNFFADLLDGEALTVALRKARASLGTLQRAPYYGWLVPVAYVVIGWLARGPGIAGVRDLYARWAVARYAIWAGLLTGAIGFATNDSGIIIPGLLLTTGIPLIVSATADAGRRRAIAPVPQVEEARRG